MNLKNNPFLKSLSILFVFALAIQVSAVWTEPPSTPPAIPPYQAPNNNTPPPVNVGENAQMKQGAFGAQGIRAVGPLGLGLFDTQVGIGSVSGAPHMPATGIELDVLGDIKFSGALMPGGLPGEEGQVLISHGTGVPTWGAGGGGGGDTFWSRNATLFYTYLANSGDKVGIGLNDPSQQLEITGSFEMPITSSSTTGVIYKGANRFMHNFGGGTFLGDTAGNFSFTNSPFNTAIGAFALDAISDGGGWGSNTAIGYGSLGSVSTGYYNTALGSHAGKDLTSGDENIFIGKDSGWLYTTGNFNVLIGRNNCITTPVTGGDYNVTIGKGAKCWNQDGVGNVALGYNADTSNQSGDYNVVIGYEAGGGAAFHSRTGSVLIGYQAGMNETGSNKLYIDNSNTNHPLIYGDFSANRLGINDGSADYSLEVVGDFGVSSAEAANGDRFIVTGTGVGIADASPDSNLEIVGTLAVSSNEANNGDRFIVNGNGIVGIGTNNPSNKAILELSSATKGFLPPRMAKAQRDAISSPPVGLMIYQTDTVGSSLAGLKIYNGTAWREIADVAD